MWLLELLFWLEKYASLWLLVRAEGVRMDCILSKRSLRRGRSVVAHPAMIPVPGSIVDQIDTLVAAPESCVSK